MRTMAKALLTALVAALVATPLTHAGADPSPGSTGRPVGSVVVTYRNTEALAAALRAQPAAVLRRLPALRAAVVRPAGDVAAFAATVAALPGIERVERQVTRRPAAEPALVAQTFGGTAPQWQYAATRSDAVPEAVLSAAAGVTIAVIDTGADLEAPDLAAKAPAAYSIRTRTGDVRDRNGHGTFVASLAAGSGTNGDGIAGAGGDARLLVVQAGAANGSFTDVDEAAAIVWAVDHGARILNLSLGGPDTSVIEQRAVDYAVGKGALLVAAVGNDYDNGNRLEYPAALLQPPGSNGAGGRGLAVGASTRSGIRASFSNTGSYVSLAAPGEGVFGAVSSLAPASRYPRVPLAGATAGLYGIGSGTSYAAPQVAGAAALVWAANPSLTAGEVADVLEQTASGSGLWNNELGFGILDVAAAVARAQGSAPEGLRLAGTRQGRRITLSWSSAPAPSWRVSVSRDGSPDEILTPATRSTSASYSLSGGSVYRFRVAALDETGSEREVSRPLTISLLRARSQLALSATRVGRHVRLRSTLTVAETSPGGRQLLLEAFDGSRWSVAGRERTNGTGTAEWRVELRRGDYRVRARFAGTDDVSPATSRALDLRL